MVRGHVAWAISPVHVALGMGRDRGQNFPEASRQLFRAAARTEIGNGQSTLFWEDRWLNGYRIEELAPVLYGCVRRSVRATRTVSQGMDDALWARDIGPEVTAAALHEYLALWTAIEGVHLDHEQQDTIAWSWEESGCFSTRTAYAARFWGRQTNPTADFTWRAKAPLQCRFFTWLAMQNRCWTSDRLARRGLDHQDRCPLCNQEEETMNHILLHCVFTREVWTAVLHSLGKLEWMPTTEVNLTDWCRDKGGRSKAMRSISAITILVLWQLWKHRNSVVFEGATPSKNNVILTIVREGRAWKQAGLLKGGMNNFFHQVEGWARPSS